MAEGQSITPSAAPVQVQVVPAADPERAAMDRFSEKLERMERAPTMQPGDRQRRAPFAEAAPAQQQESATEQAAPAQGEEAPAEDEHYEFEFRDGKYQVPKELKELHDGYLRQEDFTRKTQELSELRRAAEAALQQSRQHQELQRALAPQVAQLNSVNERLQQYMKVDWNVLFQSDPNAAQQHSVQFSVLNNQKQALERDINSTAQAHVTKLTESQKQMRDASDKAMAQKVKGWTPDTRNALNEFARKSYGFTESELNDTLDPRALEMMHEAKQWRDLQASKSSKVVIPQKTLKPAAATPTSGNSEKIAELRRGMRLAKTEGERDKFAERIFASKLR